MILPFTLSDALALVLVVSRVIFILMAFPFFNTTQIPRNIKILLVIALSFFIVKNMQLDFEVNTYSLDIFVVMVLKEAFLGFSLGLLINFFIAAMSYAAEIISYFMGLTIANMFDPTFGQVSILSRLFIILFYILFFSTDAYAYFFATLFMSFRYLPLGLPHLDGGIFSFLIEQSSILFTIAFKLAFPFALILYLLNLALALVNRLIPQINVFIVGLPMQIFVGIAALGVGVSVLVYTGSSLLQSVADEFVFIIKHIG